MAKFFHPLLAFTAALFVFHSVADAGSAQTYGSGTTRTQGGSPLSGTNSTLGGYVNGGNGSMRASQAGTPYRGGSTRSGGQYQLILTGSKDSKEADIEAQAGEAIKRLQDEGVSDVSVIILFRAPSSGRFSVSDLKQALEEDRNIGSQFDLRSYQGQICSGSGGGRTTRSAVVRTPAENSMGSKTGGRQLGGVVQEAVDGFIDDGIREAREFVFGSDDDENNREERKSEE
jgi:hypothetical protein